MDINIATIYILKVNQHIDDKKMNGEKIRQKRTFGQNGEFFRRKLQLNRRKHIGKKIRQKKQHLQKTANFFAVLIKSLKVAEKSAPKKQYLQKTADFSAASYNLTGLKHWRHNVAKKNSICKKWRHFVAVNYNLTYITKSAIIIAKKTNCWEKWQ